MGIQLKKEKLNPQNFVSIVPTRMEVISQAPEACLPKDYEVNMLAEKLHPKVQYVKIASICEHGKDAKSFTLVPDTEKGTKQLAYFSAGQYLSVALTIGHSRLWKPYSICSGPSEALQGSYTLTIKRAAGGFASEYILENWKVGDCLEVSAPEGTFTYEPLRDAGTVVGIAGGSGITPFHSLASAIADGTEDVELILLYGSRNRESILLKEEFDRLSENCGKIKVVHVLSDETAEGYEHGFITADLIKKYAPDGKYSIFLCGPQAMYEFADKEIAGLNLAQKWIRHELFGQVQHPESMEDYPKDVEGKIFNLTIIRNGEQKTIPAMAGESLLTAIERAGIPIRSRCRSGECGICHSHLVEGNVYIPEAADGRRAADRTYGYIHPCCTFPTSDILLEIPGITELGGGNLS